MNDKIRLAVQELAMACVSFAVWGTIFAIVVA